MSSLALGYNGIEIQRGMTTSSTAIFIPFMTRELRMDGQALYYGMNALSNNVIMADRKKTASSWLTRWANMPRWCSAWVGRSLRSPRTAHITFRLWTCK